MNTLKNIIATLALALSLNGAAEKLVNMADSTEKPTKEKVKIKEAPSADEKAPMCEGGGGGSIG